jgi:hypothetical protein
LISGRRSRASKVCRLPRRSSVCCASCRMCSSPPKWAKCEDGRSIQGRRSSEYSAVIKSFRQRIHSWTSANPLISENRGGTREKVAGRRWMPTRRGGADGSRYVEGRASMKPLFDKASWSSWMESQGQEEEGGGADVATTTSVAVGRFRRREAAPRAMVNRCKCRRGRRRGRGVGEGGELGRIGAKSYRERARQLEY